MTRWLRLSVTLTKSLVFGKRLVSPLEDMRICLRTWFTEADISLINNASIFTYFESGLINTLVRLGLFPHVLGGKYHIVLASTHVEFFKVMRRFQKIELQTKLLYWDTDGCWVEQKIFAKTKNGFELASKATLKIAIREGRKNTSLNDFLKLSGRSVPVLEWVKEADSANRLQRDEGFKRVS